MTLHGMSSRARTLGALLCLASLGAMAQTQAPAPAQPQAPAPPPEAAAPWRKARAQVRVACGKKDWDACKAAVTTLHDLTGGPSNLVYNLASIEALRGNGAGALEWLRQLAAMGRFVDAAHDDDFAGVRKDAAFEARFQVVLKSLEKNRAGVRDQGVLATLPVKDLIAEDVTRAKDGALYVSSVRKGVIFKLAEGKFTELVHRQPDVWGLFAVAADDAHGKLWATTASVPQVEGFQKDTNGRTALLAFSLADGKLLERHDLGGPADVRALGDLTVGKDGTVYAADGLTGHVYRLAPGGKELDEIGTRVDFQSAQGMVELSPTELLVADYLRGLAVIDLKTLKVRFLEHAPDLALDGIDGLIASGDGFVAVQNGSSPARVIFFTLDKRRQRVRTLTTLAQGETLDEPTHCVNSPDGLVCLAFSGWDHFSDDGAPKGGGPVEAPRLMRVALPK